MNQYFNNDWQLCLNPIETQSILRRQAVKGTLPMTDNLVTTVVFERNGAWRNTLQSNNDALIRRDMFFQDATYKGKKVWRFYVSEHTDSRAFNAEYCIGRIERNS